MNNLHGKHVQNCAAQKGIKKKTLIFTHTYNLKNVNNQAVDPDPDQGGKF